MHSTSDIRLFTAGRQEPAFFESEVRKRKKAQSVSTAWAGSFSPFSAVHEAGESATCLQEEVRADCPAVLDQRAPREATVDRPILRTPPRFCCKALFLMTSRFYSSGHRHRVGINRARIQSARPPASISRLTNFIITVYFSSCDACRSWPLRIRNVRKTTNAVRLLPSIKL